MNCCERHAIDCREGRSCPMRLHRLQPSDFTSELIEREGGHRVSGADSVRLSAGNRAPARSDWSRAFLYFAAAVALALVAAVFQPFQP